MPIYVYRCASCGERFDLMRPFVRADDPAPCPACAHPAERRLARFAAFSKGGGGTATAVAGGGGCGACAGGSCARCAGGCG